MSNVVQALWIGGSLPPMQQLSIASFLAHGHEYHLYAYDEIENAPSGVVICDASQIFPRDRIFVHQKGFGKGSHSTFSNLFRYKLILERGGWWVDTDLVCLKRFDFDQPYLFASENDDGALLTSTCVFRCPPGAECLEYCLRTATAKNPGDLRWSEIGPYLFDTAIKRFDLIEQRVPPHLFNPVQAREFTEVLQPDFDMSRLAGSYGLHLWSQLWKDRRINPDRDAHPDSLYARLKTSHGVARAPAVSIVTIFLNAERFIEEAIASVFAQSFRDWELILVDDGSSDRGTTIARQAAVDSADRVRYVEHPGHANRGMSPSRRLGVEHARGRLVAFLDADDTWLPHKLAAQVALLDAEPRAGAIYGTPLYWHGWTGDADDAAKDHVPGLGFEGDRLFEPTELLFLTAPFGGGPVACPSDVMVRREAIEHVGGFEAAFRGAYEDVAFFSKLYLHEPVLATSQTWTRYRIHSDSCMAVTVRDGRYHDTRLFFLNWFEQYLAREGLAGSAPWEHLQRTLAPYRHPLSTLAMSAPERSAVLSAAPNPVPVGSTQTTITWSTRSDAIGQVWVAVNGGAETLFGEGASGSQEATWINPGAIYEFRLYGDTTRSTLLDTVAVSRLVDPGVGAESFGSLRRVIPVSSEFGFDRGQPVDRYYIDRFLDRHRADIRGRVLEIGESTYTRRFGGDRVGKMDVLHVHDGNSDATIVGDLADGPQIPSSAFDCVLLVQTLHLIFDVAAAIRTLYRILKPGGVLLATFPGISQRSRDEWGDTWYWGFTSLSARRLFENAFPAGALTIESHGNVLASAAFLYGLASSELTSDELNYVDDRYETLLTVRAVKPADAPG